MKLKGTIFLMNMLFVVNLYGGEDRGYFLEDAVWNNYNISVCWENLDDLDSTAT